VVLYVDFQKSQQIMGARSPCHGYREATRSKRMTMPF
jgi:hypothetical protein